MEGMNGTHGVLPGETPESILAGIKKLSGEIALQECRSAMEQQQVSQQAQSAGTGGSTWDLGARTLLGGDDFPGGSLMGRGGFDLNLDGFGGGTSLGQGGLVEMEDGDHDPRIPEGIDTDVFPEPTPCKPDFFRAKLWSVGLGPRYANFSDALYGRICDPDQTLVLGPYGPCDWGCSDPKTEPCDSYRVPWEVVDPSCRQKHGPPWNRQPYSEEEMNQRCGGRCIGHKTLPSEEAIAEAVPIEIIVEDTVLPDGSVVQGMDSLVPVIQCGWFLLMENTDLVTWLACMVAGNDGDCLVNRITKNPPKIIVRDRRGEVQSSFSGYSAPPNRIIIYQNSPTNISRWLAYDLDNDDLTSDRRHATCACVDMAGLLLHELAHKCLYTPHWITGPCDEIELLDDTITWALAQRYSESLMSGCCSDYQSSQAWAADAGFQDCFNTTS